MKTLKTTILGFTLIAVSAVAQNYPAAPPNFSQEQLDSLVSRIALYPDPLLAQVLAAATFPDQIRDAAQWADQNRNFSGNELADAIQQANLPFDPAVQALLPFPSVLDTMAQDMNWTSDLGNAFLADREAVMDAVQQMRRTAENYGYLQSNNQMRVTSGGSGIEIEPYDPGMVYVPVYDPYVVYAAPRPGFYVGSAIRFGGGYPIGVFGAWGWGGGFNWYNHAVLVNHVAWGRTWYNRDAYVHNYGNWDGGHWRNSGYNRSVNIDRNYNRTNTYRTYNNDQRTVYRNDTTVNQYRGGYNNGQQNTYRNDTNVNQYRGGYNNGQQNTYRNDTTVNQYRGGYNNNGQQQRNTYQNNNNVNQFRGSYNNDQQRNSYRAPQAQAPPQAAPQQRYSAPERQTFRQPDRTRYERTDNGNANRQSRGDSGFRHERR